MKGIIALVFLSLVGIGNPLLAQDPKRFEKEVAEITGKTPSHDKDFILFTGSSTIRMWKDIGSYFPDQKILNRGFGGSQTSDLLYFADQLIVSANPKKIFIYEGDNDLGSGKSQEQILNDSKALVAHIRKALGQVPVVFITPKPSKARWHLKEKYVAYNKALMEWAGGVPGVSVADLWTPMLDEKGVVMQDIFLEDGLHMNKKGYDIWGQTLLPYVK